MKSNRYLIELSYRGTSYHGWQRQPNAISIQQVVEDALSKIMRRQVSITGAGRTDTGVHARRMYAHFDIENLPLPEERLAYSLNTMCGADISVHGIRSVADDFHARFDATSRTYRYLVHFSKNPYLSGLSWQAPFSLDVEAMNQAAYRLLEVRDFTSFAKLHSDTKTNICDVRKAVWQPYETFYGEKGLYFEIEADRFLRNMVRAVVGTLVEVGRGKLTLKGFDDVIDAKNRSEAGNSMPAHALYLWNVIY